MKNDNSDLEKYFRNNTGRLIHKWNHYFDIYERHFNRFRNKEVVILEIGVSQGGSLQMWKNYFGGKAKIYGIDVNPSCKELEEENIKIFIGSQSDRKFLRGVKESIPKVDILIDDGGHNRRDPARRESAPGPRARRSDPLVPGPGRSPTCRGGNM